MISRPPPATGPAPPPGRRRRMWLTAALWGLLGLLIGASALALIPACGVGVPGGHVGVLFCPAVAEPSVDRNALVTLRRERDREAMLRDRLRQLDLALARAPDCPRPPDPAPPPAPPVEVAEAPPAPEVPFLPPTPTERPPAPDRPPPPPPPPQPTPQPSPPAPPPAATPPPPSDPDMDSRLDREGVADQDVMITLVWDNGNDIDLHVICPNGQRISWETMAGCGGRLDVDANASGPQTRSPVENISWPGAPPRGSYRVEVHHFANHGDRDPTAYRVRVRIGGEDRVFSGTLRPNQRVSVHRFTMP